MLILGIDPGLQRTGWGIIRNSGSQLSYIDCGVITSNAEDDLAVRLKSLSDALAQVIARHRPQQVAIEETFVSVNGASTLKLGQARGALLLTLSQADLPVREYAARLVKKSITGSGSADKNQMTAMVRMLLPGCQTKSADAADALAIAICHANHSLSYA